MGREGGYRMEFVSKRSGGRAAARLGPCGAASYRTATLQTLLTVLLLVAGFLAGFRFRSVRRVAVPLGGLVVAVMVTNSITARVVEAGDWPAFVVSAVVVLGLVWGLAWAGARVANRRT
jgi:hypothetical protein